MNNWNSITLPGNKKPTYVWYAEKTSLTYRRIVYLQKGTDPHYIYLNGLFSFRFFLLPLLGARYSNFKFHTIICPRGMLQKGALAGKSFKKRIYLNFLKIAGIIKKVKWHATNEEEKEDIFQFCNSSRITIAMNIPKKILPEVTLLKKSPGTLRCIYLSLITEKKNLFFLLELINSTENISLDIYGPVKDIIYWQKCQKLIEQMPEKVKYCGDILPIAVQHKLAEYHALTLLTKGENFGHALYETLSVGRPIITSNFTPWNNLEEKNAGWNLDITNISACITQLNKIRETNQSDYSNFCIGAYKMAKEYYSQSINLSAYKKLFS